MRAIGSHVVLVLAAIVAIWAARVLPARLDTAWREARAAEQVAAKLRDGRSDFRAYADGAVKKADEQATSLASASGAELDHAETRLRSERAAAQGRVLDGGGLARAALTGDADAIVSSYRAAHVEIPLADRALRVIAARRRNIKVIGSLNRRIADFNRRATKVRTLQAERARLERESAGELRDPVCQRLVVPGVCPKRRRLRELDNEIGTRPQCLRSEKVGLETEKRLLKLASTGVVNGRALLDRATKAFAAEAQTRSGQAGGHVLNVALGELKRSGPWAVAIVTAGFLAGPIGRAIGFLLFAPMAERARPLRLAPAGRPSRLLASGEAVEAAVGPAVDLYLRDAAQGGADGTGARTVARPGDMGFLAARSSGLAGAQLLWRDAPGRVALAPFADGATDIASVEVLDGGAVAFVPRALVGVAVPRGAALEVRRVWRLFDARSWATLRFRHHLFHGPGTLFLQGRRGVAARTAGDGWAGDARLTIAHDAHLARGARRRGSLWRFARGRQSLFDDAFTGDGLVYAERLPSRDAAAERAGGSLRRLGELILKPFGL